MGLRKGRGKLQGLLAGPVGLLQGVRPGGVVHVDEGRSLGDTGPGRGVGGVDLDGSFEHLPGVSQALDPGIQEELVAPEVVLVGSYVRGVDSWCRFPGLAVQDYPEGPGHLLGDSVFDGEHVLHLTVEPLRPEVVPIRRVHQLGGDPDPVLRPLDTSLQDGAHVQLPADGPDVLGSSPVSECGSPGRHPEVRDLHQGVHDLLAQPITEIVVPGILAHVHEGQDGHGAALGT